MCLSAEALQKELIPFHRLDLGFSLSIASLLDKQKSSDGKALLQLLLRVIGSTKQFEPFDTLEVTNNPKLH